MKKKILTVLFIILCVPLYGQQTAQRERQLEIDLDQTVYFINDIEFDITGRTRPYAIINNVELEIGEEITGIDNLEKYIQDKRQLLHNQRVIQTSSIEYTIEERQQDGRFPVNLVITAQDTNNIIALPYPKFDTNSGFEIIIKARDYNFLGTMNPLRIDIGYRRDTNDLNYFSLMIDYIYPLNFLNLNWRIDFDSFAEYRPEFTIPWYFYNSIGLSATIPIGNVNLNIGISERLKIYEEHSDDWKNNGTYGYTDVHNGLYLTTRPSISLSVPLFEIGNYGYLWYSPSVSATFNHELNNWPLPHYRIGPWMSISHSLSSGRINWKGNFRDGMSFNISNSYNFDFYEHKMGRQLFSYYLGAVFTFHKAYEDHFSLSLRAMYRQWFDTATTTGGDVLRGIVDKDVHSDIMFSVNTNLTIGILKFRPSEWFNYRRLRYFNFDMQFSPFLDAAVFRSKIIEDRYPNASFFYKNLLFSGGIEIFVYPLAFRSLQLRASLGINLSLLDRNYNNRVMGTREIFIGTEFHY